MAVENTQLSESILRKYKSLGEPDFSFVSKVIASKPYDALVQQLQSLVEVEEITDSNDDVSFCYVLSDMKNQWEIQLSMIGLYAVIFRKAEAKLSELVVSAISEQEEKIVSLLNKYQFEILQPQVLEQKSALSLFNAGQENTCIYQALFSDTDILPWKA